MKGTRQYLVPAAIGLSIAVLAFVGGMMAQRVKMRGSYALNEVKFMEGERMGRARGGMRSRGMFPEDRLMMRGPVSGEIIEKDEATITVKMEDGSSKIVTISQDTKVVKSSEASQEDLKVGEKVTVMGGAGQQGSIPAESILLGESFLPKVVTQETEVILDEK